jgi:tetratricopeptide (TPR) repeat protein
MGFIKLPQSRFTAFMAFTVLVAIVVYLGSIKSEFLFNVSIFMDANESIKSLGSIPSFFLAPHDAPITKLFFTVNYALWGTSAYGYHVMSIVLHATASVMVGLFARELMNMRGAVFAAMAFALHPVHTDAVAGLVGVGEVIALIFVLIAFMFFLRQGRGFYLFSSLAFVIALLASKSALALPLLLLIHTLFFRERHDLIRIAPFFALGVIYLILYLLLTPPDSLSSLPIDERLFTGLTVFGLSFKLLFLPIGLNAVYAFAPIDKFLSFAVIASLQLIVLSVFLSIVCYRYSKSFSYAVIFIPITLVTVFHILPQGELMSESFLYLPSVGFCLLFGLLFQWIARGSMQRAGVIALLPFLIFAALTFSRLSVWADDYSILSDIVLKSPDNAIVHYNLGVAMDDKGMKEEALLEYERAIELQPSFSGAYYNIACIYSLMGNEVEALKALKWAVARGFNDVRHMRSDPDLDAIRGTREFEEILRSAESGAAFH